MLWGGAGGGVGFSSGDAGRPAAHVRGGGHGLFERVRGEKFAALAGETDRLTATRVWRVTYLLFFNHRDHRGFFVFKVAFPRKSRVAAHLHRRGTLPRRFGYVPKRWREKPDYIQIPRCCGVRVRMKSLIAHWCTITLSYQSNLVFTQLIRAEFLMSGCDYVIAIVKPPIPPIVLALVDVEIHDALL